MRVMRWAFVGALAIGMTVLADAQQPGRQPGRQPGGQPGGFGFGGGFGGAGFGGLSSQITTNKDLQAELKISEEQVDKIKALREKQQAELRKLMEKIQEDNRKEFEATLTPAQAKRLKQLEVQNQGLRAFTTETNVKALNLSETQVTKIKAVVDEAQKTIGEARREGFGGFGGGGRPDAAKMEEVNKKVQKLEKQAMADVADLLTADQQKVWAEMVGEPFDTSKLRQGFGGFGGGGFPGGGTRPQPKKD